MTSEYEEIDILIKDDDTIESDNPFLEIKKSSNKRSYKRKKEEDEINRKNSKIFWKNILDHPIGRKEVWSILQETHAFEDRFACGPNGFPQSEATWFHAGEQAYGLRFYHKLMGLHPQAMVIMHKENDPRFLDIEGI